MSLLFQLNVFD